MGAGRGRRDAHAGRDEPGVLAVGDPHQDLHLPGCQHLEQPLALVVGLGGGVEQFAEGPLEQLRGHGRLARPRLHDRALDALYAFVMAYVAGGAAWRTRRRSRAGSAPGREPGPPPAGAPV